VQEKTALLSEIVKKNRRISELEFALKKQEQLAAEIALLQVWKF